MLDALIAHQYDSFLLGVDGTVLHDIREAFVAYGRIFLFCMGPSSRMCGAFSLFRGRLIVSVGRFVHLLVYRCVCVCVLHIKPIFLPVHTQHNLCACQIFDPREIQALWSHRQLRHRKDTPLLCSKRDSCSHTKFKMKSPFQPGVVRALNSLYKTTSYSYYGEHLKIRQPSVSCLGYCVAMTVTINTDRVATNAAVMNSAGATGSSV